MSSQTSSETDAIRSDIEMTRQRMDQTMEALTERLHGRHLLDEVIGFFRGGEDSSGAGARIRENITHSAGTAANAVVDTVKKNPLPFLLIGAGAAWLAYSATRARSASLENSEGVEDDPYDAETHTDRPLSYGYPESGSAALSGESTSEPGYESGDSPSSMKERFSDLTDRAKEKMQTMKDRAADFGGRVQDRTRELYGATRERVASAVDEHPLEIGLGCLAVGIVAGLTLPTPAPVHRYAGPAVDRLRNRAREAGREMFEKGKRVAQAAGTAAQTEARSQGLSSPGSINPMPATGQPVSAPFPREILRDEGKGPGATEVSPSADNNLRAGAGPADPSAAGPAM